MPSTLCDADASKASRTPTSRTMTFVVFSGSFDQLAAGFSMASAAAAMGVEVSMFFNFWGLLAIRQKRTYKGKSVLDRLLTAFMPKGARRSTRLNMLGLGPLVFSKIMAHKGVSSLPELLQTCQDMGVRIVACQTSMDVFGVTLEELPPGTVVGGAAGCVQGAVEGSAIFI